MNPTTGGSLNELLQWSIRNSAPNADASAATAEASRGLSAEAISQLLGGPSDADRMRDAMAAIESPEVDLANKLIAFDNFEQLVENIDNANNMEPLGLWAPMLRQLANEERELRKMAAWCLGTAVQNNVKAQERFLAVDGIPALVKLATEDPAQDVRRKAIYALSSSVRNFQPGLDIALKHLPEEYKTTDTVDAGDMEAVTAILDKIREAANQLA